MALFSTSGLHLRPCMIFLTLSTFILASFALPHNFATAVTQCVPADFRSVLIFFLANYIAHAATVPSAAGCSNISAMWIIASVFYPFFGLIRSIILLYYYYLAEDEIGRAISQRAVLVAARSENWVPRFTGNEVEVYVGLRRRFPENTVTPSGEPHKAWFHTLQDISESPEDFSEVQIETNHFALHGETSLPEGYFWSKPETQRLDALASCTDRKGIQVGRTKNTVKGFASVAQLIFSSITIYRARGSQLQRYGYAAFGLSVFPYALMSLINLVAATIVGEYPTLFVLRTAILDEAKQCGGAISGEIGTLCEVTQSASAVEPPTEGGGSNGADSAEKVTPSPPVDDSNDEHSLGEANKTTTTGTPPEAKDIGSVGTGREGTNVSGVPMEDSGEEFLLGEKPFVAAKLRVREDGVLVIKMEDHEGWFKLVNREEVDDDTYKFHVSAVTNQHMAWKGEELSSSRFALQLIYVLFFLILVTLPYVFIFLLTNFRKGDSTSAQRGWMMSWLVFSQISSFFGFSFSISDMHQLANPWSAPFFVLLIFMWSTPAIGGFVVVGRMLLESGTCSLL